MAPLAADRHGVAAAAGECLSQALFWVEGFAALIEDYLGEIGAKPHLAVIGDQRPIVVITAACCGLLLPAMRLAATA
jgi:hypothetical protein